MWVSDYPTHCGDPLCGSLTAPGVVAHAEVFHAREQVFIGSAICAACGADHGYSRRPTKAELKEMHAHLRTARTLSPKGPPAMFADRTPMLLKKVTLGVETVDDETRRVVQCQFEIEPFTATHAEALNVKRMLFGGDGLPLPAYLDAHLKIAIPNQRLAWAPAPDVDADSIVVSDVMVNPKLHVKLKTDRKPAVFVATLSVTFRYPDPADLFFICNSVKDQHFLTFTQSQPPLNFAGKDEETAAPAGPPRHRGKANGRGEAAHA